VVNLPLWCISTSSQLTKMIHKSDSNGCNASSILKLILKDSNATLEPSTKWLISSEWHLLLLKLLLLTSIWLWCCPILPAQQASFVIGWEGQYYINHNAFFSTSSFSGVFGHFADAYMAILWALKIRSALNWVNDTLIFNFSTNTPSINHTSIFAYSLNILSIY